MIRNKEDQEKDVFSTQADTFLKREEKLYLDGLISQLNSDRASKKKKVDSIIEDFNSNPLSKIPRIKKAFDARLKKAQEDLELSPERTLREYQKIAFSDISDFYEWDENGRIKVVSKDKLDKNKTAAIAEIHFGYFDEYDEITGKTIKVEKITKIKLHDKIRALEALSKHLGLFERDNLQKNQGVTIDEVLSALPTKMQAEVRMELLKSIGNETIN